MENNNYQKGRGRMWKKGDGEGGGGVRRIRWISQILYVQMYMLPFVHVRLYIPRKYVNMEMSPSLWTVESSVTPTATWTSPTWGRRTRTTRRTPRISPAPRMLSVSDTIGRLEQRSTYICTNICQEMVLFLLIINIFQSLITGITVSSK